MSQNDSQASYPVFMLLLSRRSKYTSPTRGGLFVYKKIEFATKDRIASDILDDVDLMDELHKVARKLTSISNRARHNDDRAIEITSTDVVESIYELLDVLVMQADQEEAES